MNSILEQVADLNAQLQELKAQVGQPKPPAPPPPPPFARSTSASYSTGRLADGKCGRSFDDGLTKIGAMEHCKELAKRTGLPIQFVDWQTDTATLTGPDAILLIEQIRVKTSDGSNNGHLPVRKWIYSNAPPKWLSLD
jgi:hypothetical protein